VDRDRAIHFIRREAEAARAEGLNARLLVLLTQGEGGAALQFEVELTSLDQLERLRHHGGGADEDAGDWMRYFSEILLSVRLGTWPQRVVWGWMAGAAVVLGRLSKPCRRPHVDPDHPRAA
jgi:hypothetical protein